MKCGVVMFSAIVQEGRLDAEHYLNPTGKLDDEIARQEMNLAAVQAALAVNKTEREKVRKRYEKIVKPLVREVE